MKVAVTPEMEVTSDDLAEGVGIGAFVVDRGVVTEPPPPPPAWVVEAAELADANPLAEPLVDEDAVGAAEDCTE